VQVVTGLIIFAQFNSAFEGFVDQVHRFNGIALGALIVVHVLMNFGWLKSNMGMGARRVHADS
jgi:cytochrome b subunit of formate dehydrogenase